MTFNLVDAMAVLVIALTVFFGWRSGFVVQAFALAGFLAGIALVVVIAPYVAGLVANTSTLLRTAIVITFVAAVVLIAQGIGSAVGGMIRQRLSSGVLSGLDSSAGSVFGFVRGLFMVWLLGGLLGVLPVGTLAAEARQSLILRAIETRLPSPVVLAAELGRIIESAGLPDIFVGAPPPADLPADGPSARQAEQIAAGARGGTVRVEAIACGNFVSGTGFAVDAHHVVTNAHVVAGSNQVWISFDGALDRHRAEVVSFDPELDAALLFVDGVALEPLRLDDKSPARAEPAAALGFTGGGRQRLIPALVSREIDARGRDIYGDGIVARKVIELRADVAPGDSGGPLLVTGGDVGGVIFSESQSDPLIGYALTPTAVGDSIAPALDSTQPVETGRCLR